MQVIALIVALLPGAEQAGTVSGFLPVVFPPPLVGGLQTQGFLNLAFQHESLTLHDRTPALLLDSAGGAHASLLRRAKRERERRRNPLYWVDRGLRAVLGVPAYLIGLVLGVPRSKIEESRWGPALRGLAVVADAAGVFALGRSFSWW